MDKCLILGSDVSKGYAEFTLIGANKETREPVFRLDDDCKGHEALKALLKKWRAEHRAHRIVFALESSGGYEDNWLRCAKDASLSAFVHAFRINPKVTRHEYLAQKRGSIDDGVSAQAIAVHVAKNLEDFQPDERPEDPRLAAARNLVRHLVSLEKAGTQQKNALDKLLYRHLSALLPEKPSGWPTYFLEILARYGAKRSILAAARRGFKRIKHVPADKARKITEALNKGTTPDTLPMDAEAIRSKAKQIIALEAEIKRLKKLFCAQAPVDQAQVKLLRSIKGMGEYTATVLLCFIEDWSRFGSAAQMAAFFGVNPRFKKSGDGGYKAKMSKQGNPLVRRELYLLAFRTISQDDYLRAIYAKRRAKGMEHDAALGVLMHKLLRIIYGMLKNGTPYNPGTDQLNQALKKEGQDKPDQTKRDALRRFQEESPEAPVSQRQRKKRKSGHEPQAAESAECTGSS